MAWPCEQCTAGAKPVRRMINTESFSQWRTGGQLSYYHDRRDDDNDDDDDDDDDDMTTTTTMTTTMILNRPSTRTTILYIAMRKRAYLVLRL
ncbi:hypothetical protein V1477_016941 [Vespula maculifrons]|uniref:Uncharacterized protein n=1 Tax=Vespula maculifrons TaxID=7453 RepID=A0ABD2B4N6_VESMC